MQADERKRRRGKNFTVEEEVALVELVEECRDVIENKKSDTVTWKQKEQTWNKIAELFAATTGSSRDSKALRDKYDCLKRKAKVELAAEKSESYRTGGGPAKKVMSNISQRIASLIGDSATGMRNMFDSDDVECEYLDAMFEEEAATDAVNIIDIGSEHEENNHQDQPSTSRNKQETSKPSRLQQHENEENNHPDKPSTSRKQHDWETWKPSSLQQPKSKRLCVSVKRRSLEDAKIELIISQRKFYEEEKRRAEEKHLEELTQIRLRNELLRLDLDKVKNGKN